MKALISSIMALTLLALCGCSTTRTVSQAQGQGHKVIYNAPFDPTWRATVDAAQVSDLRVIDANRETGYIVAKRGIRPETFGENVGIWVTREGLNQTGVEVVSRQAGPPVLWMKNWEKEIQGAVAANLTREAPFAVGTAAPGSGTVTGGQVGGPVVAPPPPVYVNPAPSTTVVVPPPAPVSPAPLVNQNTTVQDTQAQIRSLQQQQLAREQELQREQDAKRRSALQDDIDILKSDLQKMQQRLNDLEREQQTIPNR